GCRRAANELAHCFSSDEEDAMHCNDWPRAHWLTVGLALGLGSSGAGCSDVDRPADRSDLYATKRQYEATTAGTLGVAELRQLVAKSTLAERARMPHGPPEGTHRNSNRAAGPFAPGIGPPSAGGAGKAE